jgi:hypothetical protein
VIGLKKDIYFESFDTSNVPIQLMYNEITIRIPTDLIMYYFSIDKLDNVRGNSIFDTLIQKHFILSRDFPTLFH